MRLQYLLKGLFAYVVICGNSTSQCRTDVIAEGFPSRLIKVLPYKYLHARVEEWYEDYDYVEKKGLGQMWYHHEFMIIRIDANIELEDDVIVEVPW